MLCVCVATLLKKRAQWILYSIVPFLLSWEKKKKIERCTWLSWNYFRDCLVWFLKFLFLLLINKNIKKITCAIYKDNLECIIAKLHDIGGAYWNKRLRKLTYIQSLLFKCLFIINIHHENKIDQLSLYFT